MLCAMDVNSRVSTIPDTKTIFQTVSPLPTEGIRRVHLSSLAPWLLWNSIQSTVAKGVDPSAVLTWFSGCSQVTSGAEELCLPAAATDQVLLVVEVVVVVEWFQFCRYPTKW